MFDDDEWNDNNNICANNFLTFHNSCVLCCDAAFTVWGWGRGIAVYQTNKQTNTPNGIGWVGEFCCDGARCGDCLCVVLVGGPTING